MKKLLFTFILTCSFALLANSAIPLGTINWFNDNGQPIVTMVHMKPGNYGVKASLPGMQATIYRCDWRITFNGYCPGTNVVNGDSIFWYSFNENGIYKVDVEIYYVDNNGITGTATATSSIDILSEFW